MTILTGEQRLNIRQAAARYGKREHTIWRLIWKEQLRAVKVLHPFHDQAIWLIAEGDLDRLAAARGWQKDGANL